MIPLRVIHSAMIVVAVATIGVVLAEDIAGIPSMVFAWTLAGGYVLVLALWIWSTRYCVICLLPLARAYRALCRRHNNLHWPWSEVHVECCPLKPPAPERRMVDVSQILWQRLCDAAEEQKKTPNSK